MAEAKYEHFIPQNIAPVGAKRIVVYDANGKLVGSAGLQNLALPTAQAKQYSYLCVSDSHIKGNLDAEDGTADFIRAMEYAKADTDIKFVTICGDVLDTYNTWLWEERFPALRDAHINKLVYPITGNHESGELTRALTSDDTLPGFLLPLYYTFRQGDDLYIMLGEAAWKQSTLFADGELQFLYDTLEANRERRVFVFFHVLNYDVGDSGQPDPTFYAEGNLLERDEANKAQRACFLELLQHYPNVTWFHGHSHARFQLQEISATNNYSEVCGYRSVHIPSLAHPTDLINGVRTKVEAESQGYVVDVYPDGIHLRGRDFVAGEFLPIASYWIDTSFVPVEANTFEDSTGLITT